MTRVPGAGSQRRVDECEILLPPVRKGEHVLAEFLPWILIGASVALAVISGANDGGSLLALNVRFPVIPLAGSVAVLCLMLVVGPLAFGVAVARTVAHDLVPGDTSQALVSFALGVVAALVIVAALSWWGLPTSLTLALIGALAGAAVGLGLPVGWNTIMVVLVVGLSAPIVGGCLGWALSRAIRYTAILPIRHAAWRPIHFGAFVLQCLAYAVNDGQKMLAVTAVATQAIVGEAILGGSKPGILVITLAANAVLFALGTLWTIRRVSKRLSRDLAQVRPLDAVVSELCASGAVFGSAVLGAPVSMTQSLAAGLVGVVGSKGLRRVRWVSVAQIAGAWIVTLPVAFAAAFVAAFCCAVVT